MKKGLMVALGHNSSALFFNGVDKPVGYEEERLNGVKSSSAFPHLSIDKIIDEIGDDLKDSKLFISHWFDSFDLNKEPDKYVDGVYLRALITRFDLKVQHLYNGFTHHNAHAYSALAFMEDNTDSLPDDLHHIVADGFGNNQEVLSVYKQNKDGSMDTIQKVYGYDNSLGLLFQYATSFTGMKPLQDEYKFLGYAADIQKYLTQDYQIGMIDKKISSFVQFYTSVTRLMVSGRKSEIQPFIDLDALHSTESYIHGVLQGVVDSISFSMGVSANRSIVGYFIQGVVEGVILDILQKHKITNVTLSGGCFYNVKLNNFVLKNTTGVVSVIPVAGDQGTGIGMYRRFVGPFKFKDLCYGNRTLKRIPTNDDMIIQTMDVNGFIETVVELLNCDMIVNIMHGSMEFGPRALCNTSTLAAPTQKNVDYINKLNDRSSVMPMAPVISDIYAQFLFDTSMLNRVVGSNSFMVMTHDYVESRKSLWSELKGVMHNYPNHVDAFSGRPQIINGHDDNEIIAYILGGCDYPCLINTSFNTHGTPILYDSQDAFDDFNKQKINDVDNRNYLVILND